MNLYAASHPVLIATSKVRSLIQGNTPVVWLHVMLDNLCVEHLVKVMVHSGSSSELDNLQSNPTILMLKYDRGRAQTDSEYKLLIYLSTYQHQLIPSCASRRLA